MNKNWLILIGSALGGVGGVFFLFLLFTDRSGSFLSAAQGLLYVREDTNLSRDQVEVLHYMLNAGAIYTPGEFMSEVSSFYERVITIFTALLGFLGVLAFMYVRTISEENALKTVNKAVETELLSKDHKQHVIDIVEKMAAAKLDSTTEGLKDLSADLDERLDRFEELTGSDTSNTIADLYSRIRIIESHIAKSDDDEDDGAEGSIS